MNVRGGWRLPLLVSVGFVAACSSAGEARIMFARLEEPTKLALSIDSCNADLSATVTESESEVRIAVTKENDTDDDCADGLIVALSEPLGERTVIDEASDQPVPVHP